MDDLISRQAAKDAINEHLELVTSGLGNDSEVKKIYKMAYNHVIDAISILPAIQPKQKMGEWVYGEFDIPHCSICGHDVMPNMVSPYCPNCGAKMS